MKNDLKKRIPTAIVYVLVIVALTMSGAVTSIVLVALLWAACQYEFTLHSKGSHPGIHLVYLGFSASIGLLIGCRYVPDPWWIYILAMGLTALTANGIGLLLTGKNALVRLPFLLQVLLYLIFPFGVVIYMLFSQDGFSLLLLGLFILIWLNDAGAYFFGKAFGKNKLFPQVSPSKTWEGFIGGGAFTLIAGVAFYLASATYSLNLWIGISLLIFIYSVVGDLVESSWKRTLGIKDTGTTLPGHGGFLDRLDSFIYSAPLMVLIVYILGL